MPTSQGANLMLKGVLAGLRGNTISCTPGSSAQTLLPITQPFTYSLHSQTPLTPFEVSWIIHTDAYAKAALCRNSRTPKANN